MSEHQDVVSTEPQWPTVAVGPSDDPKFLVFFHGLFAFAYNQETSVCEVGTHAKADDHDFGIYVLEFDGESSNILYSFTPDSPSNVDGAVILKVHNDSQSAVRFFQAAEPSESDWSRVIDVEGPLFYNRKLDKKTSRMKPRIYIHSGLFFTADTTSPYTFRRAAGDDSEELGVIAFLPALELAHAEGGFVSLSIENQEVRLAAKGGKRYAIVFANHCPPDECIFDPGSNDKEKRNDFYMHYRTFHKPLLKPEFELIFSAEQDSGRSISGIAFVNVIIEALSKVIILGSRDSPCGGIGFGQSSGLD